MSDNADMNGANTQHEITTLDDFSATLERMDLRDGDFIVLRAHDRPGTEEWNEFCRLLHERLKKYNRAKVTMLILPMGDDVTKWDSAAIRQLLNDAQREERLRRPLGGF